jgi:hypothetical protein
LNDIDTYLSIAADVTAIGALVFGARQFRDARRTIASLGIVSNQMEATERTTKTLLTGIEHGISTRALGNFPAYHDEIVNVLKAATNKITICCDLLGYGMCTDPEVFQGYISILQHKSVDMPVRIVYLSDDMLRSVLYDQLTEPEWQQWRDATRDGIKALLLENKEVVPVPELSIEEFTSALLVAQSRLRRRLDPDVRNVQLTQTDHILPLYFWIADRTAAVVALTKFDGGVKEVGFRTSDRNMIDSLIGIYDRYALTKHTAGLRAG